MQEILEIIFMSQGASIVGYYILSLFPVESRGTAFPRTAIMKGFRQRNLTKFNPLMSPKWDGGHIHARFL